MWHQDRSVQCLHIHGVSQQDIHPIPLYSAPEHTQINFRLRVIMRIKQEAVSRQDSISNTLPLQY